MALQRMSIKDYVEYRKRHEYSNEITCIAVAKAIRMGHRTPGIKAHEKYGGTYLLYVDLAELDQYLVTIKKPITLHA